MNLKIIQVGSEHFPRVSLAQTLYSLHVELHARTYLSRASWAPSFGPSSNRNVDFYSRQG